MAGSLKGLSDFAGDVGGHRRTAAMNFVNGFQKLGAFSSLEQIAFGAGSECAENIVGVFVHSQHDDLEFGNELLQLANTFDAVDARKVDIHKDDLGADLGNVLEGVRGAAVMAEAFETLGAIKHAGECVAELLVIFDDGNGGRHYENSSVMRRSARRQILCGEPHGNSKSEARNSKQ